MWRVSNSLRNSTHGRWHVTTQMRWRPLATRLIFLAAICINAASIRMLMTYPNMPRINHRTVQHATTDGSVPSIQTKEQIEAWVERLEYSAPPGGYKPDTIHVAMTACGSGQDRLPESCDVDVATGLPCPHFKLSEKKLSAMKGAAKAAAKQSIEFHRRVQEALVMMKSAVLTTSTNLFFHIFVSDDIAGVMETSLKQWPAKMRQRFGYHMFNIAYPSDHWRNMFRRCSTQRLFIPYVLKDINNLLYIDIDAVILRPLDDMWGKFADFDKSQVFGMAVESFRPSYYTRYPSILHLPPHGHNAGMLMLKADRIRESDWINNLTRISLEQNTANRLGDQDILNHYAFKFPHTLYTMPCSFNYRLDYCLSGEQDCLDAERDGVAIAHGNRAAFHDRRHTDIYQIVYDAFRDYPFGSSYRTTLLGPITQAFSTQALRPGCTTQKHGAIFYKGLQRTSLLL